MKRLNELEWILVAGWLAGQCAESYGCWDDEGAHPCQNEDGDEDADCKACWLRRAMREVRNEFVR